MKDYSSGIPKGRAMRASVATAIKVESIPGVRRVIADTYDDIVYVQCTPSAWAEIQALGAKAVGVEHTGAVRRQWLADRDEVYLVGLREDRGPFQRFTVELTLDADGSVAYERTTPDYALALRWQRYLLWVPNKAEIRKTIKQQALVVRVPKLDLVLDIGTALMADGHAGWMMRHPAPRLS